MLITITHIFIFVTKFFIKVEHKNNIVNKKGGQHAYGNIKTYSRHSSDDSGYYSYCINNKELEEMVEVKIYVIIGDRNNETHKFCTHFYLNIFNVSTMFDRNIS